MRRIWIGYSRPDETPEKTRLLSGQNFRERYNKTRQNKKTTTILRTSKDDYGRRLRLPRRKSVDDHEPLKDPHPQHRFRWSEPRGIRSPISRPLVFLSGRDGDTCIAWRTVTGPTLRHRTYRTLKRRWWRRLSNMTDDRTPHFVPKIKEWSRDNPKGKGPINRSLSSERNPRIQIRTPIKVWCPERP